MINEMVASLAQYNLSFLKSSDPYSKVDSLGSFFMDARGKDIELGIYGNTIGLPFPVFGEHYVYFITEDKAGNVKLVDIAIKEDFIEHEEARAQEWLDKFKSFDGDHDYTAGVNYCTLF